MNRTRKNMGLTLLPLSFLFLFNPELTVMDFLPDALGYLILMLSLSNLSDINYHVENAKNRFKLAALLSLGKIVSLLVLFGLVSQNDRSVAMLTVAFVFSTCELILLIPAYKELFEGLLGLGMDCDGKAVFEPVGNSNISERMLRRTITFLVVKVAASTLPEFTALIDNTEYRFANLLRGFGFIIALIFGIIWFISFFSYIRRVRRDRTFIENLTEKFNALVRERPDLFLKRKLLFGLSLIFGAFIFSIDWYSNYYNVIPSFICPIILIIAAIYLRKYSRTWKNLCLISAIYGGISLFSWITSLKFFESTYPEAALKVAEVYDSYMFMLYTVLADALFFIILVLYSLSLVKEIASVHAAPRTKQTWDKTDDAYIDFNKGSILLIILSVICSVLTVYYTYSLPSRASVWYVEMAWIFAFLADVAVLICAYNVLNKVKKEISSRYHLA